MIFYIIFNYYFILMFSVNQVQLIIHDLQKNKNKINTNYHKININYQICITKRYSALMNLI